MLSARDMIGVNTFPKRRFHEDTERVFEAVDGRSLYPERLLNRDGSCCRTFKEAIDSYEYRTGNCLVGSMGVSEIEDDLITQGLNWSAI